MSERNTQRNKCELGPVNYSSYKNSSTVQFMSTHPEIMILIQTTMSNTTVAIWGAGSTLPEHQSSSSVIARVRDAQSLVFVCCVLYNIVCKLSVYVRHLSLNFHLVSLKQYDIVIFRNCKITEKTLYISNLHVLKKTNS